MANPIMQGQDTSYKPWGMLAGGMVGSREADQEMANMLALQESQLGNVIKGVEAGRADADFRDPRMEALRQQGIMGDNMGGSAAGQLAMGTLDSTMGARNAKNAADQSGAEIDNVINAMDQSLAILEANGPAGMSMVLPHMPPQLQELAKQTGQQFPQVLAKLSELLKQQRSQTPKHLGELESQSQKYSMEGDIHSRDNTSRERVAELDRTSRETVAGMNKSGESERNAESAAMRREQEITRRMEFGRHKLGLVQNELKAINEELSMPMFGKPEQKAAKKKELADRKKELLSQYEAINTEMDRLSKYSTFAPESGTSSKPIKLD